MVSPRAQILAESPSGVRNPPCLLIMPGLLRSDRGGLSGTASSEPVLEAVKPKSEVLANLVVDEDPFPGLTMVFFGSSHGGAEEEAGLP